MSQFNFDVEISDSGSSLVSKLDSFRDSLYSHHSGSSRPSYIQAGGTWVKTVSSSLHEVYLYDGSSDILVFTYNPTTHVKEIDAEKLAGSTAYNKTTTSASDPGATGAYSIWNDTTTGFRKQRNAANSAWIVKGALAASGDIRTNAGNPNGSVTGNYQGELLLDTTNGIYYGYSGSGTAWTAQQSANNPLLALPALYHDMRITYVDANTIRILAGSRCRSLDNTRDIVFASDYDISMTNGTPTFSQGGRTVAEAADTWYYLYVGLDSSNRPIAWLDTANLAGGGTPTNPAAYSTGRRQIRFFVRNNASSDILPFGYSLNAIVSWTNYNVTTNDYIAFSNQTSTSFVTIGSFPVPPIARRIDCYAFNGAGGTGTLFLRPTGSGISTGHTIVLNSGDYRKVGWFDRLNSSGQLDYQVSGIMLAALLINAIEVTEVF